MVRCHGHVRLREPLGYWQLRLPHSQSLAIPCQSGNRLGRDCSPRLRKSISSRWAHGGWEPATGVYEPLNVMVVATWSCHLTDRILRFHSLQGKNSAFTGIARGETRGFRASRRRNDSTADVLVLSSWPTTWLSPRPRCTSLHIAKVSMSGWLIQN
jgi:hypothetical protein